MLEHWKYISRKFYSLLIMLNIIIFLMVFINQQIGSQFLWYFICAILLVTFIYKMMKLNIYLEEVEEELKNNIDKKEDSETTFINKCNGVEKYLKEESKKDEVD